MIQFTSLFWPKNRTLRLASLVVALSIVSYCAYLLAKLGGYEDFFHCLLFHGNLTYPVDLSNALSPISCPAFVLSGLALSGLFFAVFPYF